MLHGDPVWLPHAGMVGGALQFDGIDDYVTTEYVVDGARFSFVLSPSDGPFSVLTSVKGGAPGQVIVSQADGVSWLMIDVSEGALATELASSAERVQPLVSDAIIIDDIWHRVAFVWDGMTRSLYVDGMLVAQDEQRALAVDFAGLSIGCRADLAPDSFFSGLIDDVRIYNRAVRP